MADDVLLAHWYTHFDEFSYSPRISTNGSRRSSPAATCRIPALGYFFKRLGLFADSAVRSALVISSQSSAGATSSAAAR